MNKNQKIVCDWFLNNGMDFLSAIVELEGVYESIPNEVAEAFSELTDKEIIEVIKKSANNTLKRIA